MYCKCFSQSQILRFERNTLQFYYLTSLLTLEMFKKFTVIQGLRERTLEVRGNWKQSIKKISKSL